MFLRVNVDLVSIKYLFQNSLKSYRPHTFGWHLRINTYNVFFVILSHKFLFWNSISLRFWKIAVIFEIYLCVDCLRVVSRLPVPLPPHVRTWSRWFLRCVTAQRLRAQTASRGRRSAQRTTPSSNYRNSKEMTVSEHWNEMFYPYESVTLHKSKFKNSLKRWIKKITIVIIYPPSCRYKHMKIF